MNLRPWRWTSPEPSARVLLGLVAAGVSLAAVLGVPLAQGSVLLCAMGVAAAFPRVGIVLLAFLAPFDGYVGSMVLYRDFLVTDAVGLAIIAGQLLRQTRLPVPAAAVPAIGALLALAALHVLSLGPDNWRIGLDNAVRFIYFVALVTVVAATADLPLVRAAVVALVAAQAVRFGAEAVIYFSSPQFVLHPSFQFGSFTSNPNSMAGFGACILPLAASLISVPSRWLKAMGLAASFALLTGILLSYSKGSWLVAAAAAAAWIWHVGRRGWRPRRAVLVAGAAILVAAVLLVPAARQVPSLIVERWQSHGSALSNQERLRYVAAARQMVFEHPFMGVGLERFGAEYMTARRATRGPDDPHNAYLMVAAELGIPALGCYALFLGIAVIAAYLHARSAGGEAAPYRMALSASVVGLLVFQLFSAEPLASRIFWLLMALSLTADSGTSATRSDPSLDAAGAL